MLKLENVTKYYGDFLAVDNLSFEVKEGQDVTDVANYELMVLVKQQHFV